MERWWSVVETGEEGRDEGRGIYTQSGYPNVNHISVITPAADLILPFPSIPTVGNVRVFLPRYVGLSESDDTRRCRLGMIYKERV